MRRRRSGLRTGVLAALLFCGIPSPDARAQALVLLPGSVRVDQVGWARASRDPIQAPQVVWSTAPDCTVVPDTGGGIPGDELSPATLSRGSTLGATPRDVFSFNPERSVGVCNPYVLHSNLVLDGDWVYYVDNRGTNGNGAIWRRRRDANPGDASQLLRDLGARLSGAEILTFGPYLFAVLHGQGTIDVLAEYFKDTGQVIDNAIITAPLFALNNLQFDGRFLYWMNVDSLWVNDTTNGARRVFAAGVSDYLPRGYGPEVCSPPPFGCDPAEAYVYYAERNRALGNRILFQDVFSGNTSVLYTTTATAFVGPLQPGALGLYFFESRPAFGGGNARDHRLLRLPLGSATAQLIYGPFVNGGFDAFASDFSFLYFRNRDARALLRIAADSPSIPVQKLRATGLEVTQGIQNPASDVPLVSGRRTFVRFHVQSDRADLPDVANVGARLHVVGPEGFLGTLEPVNPVGRTLTVKRVVPDGPGATKPSRSNLDDSFLFELPIEWTRKTTLSFSATVNPTGVIVEDDFGDNTVQSPTFIVSASPRLPLEVVSWWYNFTSGGITSLVTGPPLDDLRSQWYMRNVYPLDLQSGGPAQAGPGLRLASRIVRDDALATWVDQTNDQCNARLYATDATGKVVASCSAGETDANCANRLATSGGTIQDDRNQCAGDYVMMRVRQMKADGTLPDDRFYYSSIAGSGATPFTRGYASSDRIACGPMTDPTQQNYMSHEVGHLLGRGHPSSGAAPVCTAQSADDPAYPHPQARIGNSTTAAGDDTAHMGLDPGDFRTSARQLRVASLHGDIMSYCSPYWISSYTYNGIYDFLSFFLPFPAPAPARAAGPVAAAPVAGDWLLAFGTVSPGSATGALLRVSRSPSVAAVPPIAPGGFAIELRSAADALLARHAFTPAADADRADVRSFGLVVPFAPGTRRLRLVQEAGAVLATRSVSASPPQISGVALVGAAEPVSGTVDVAWTASDPDGDPLRFDVLYSHDGGASFEPVKLSVPGLGTDLDTSRLAGGTGRLRVVAHDGVQTASADSAPFLVATKPPLLRIAHPEDGLRVQWGQLVNFIASAEDPDGSDLPSGAFSWSNAYRTLGTGSTLGVSDLEVGDNPVTLTVTDGQGQVSTATVHVLVGDDLAAPGPRLSASPGSVAWSVPGDAGAVPAAELRVRNVGGGSLHFTAASDRPWLKIDGAAEADTFADAALALTADATQIPDLTLAQGTITLTNVANAQDVLVVPVTLSKGDLVGGRPATDQDADGIPDGSDDCLTVPDGPSLPALPALTQRDTDGDGYGNACDPDFNNDGVVNFADLAQMRLRFFGSDPDADLNGDGLVNFADLARLRTYFLKPPGPSGLAP